MPGLSVGRFRLLLLLCLTLTTSTSIAVSTNSYNKQNKSGTISTKVKHNNTGIRGSIEFYGCPRAPTTVMIQLTGPVNKTIRVIREQIDGSNQYLPFDYLFTSLPAGSYLVKPSISATQCPGGLWSLGPKYVRSTVGGTVFNLKYRISKPAPAINFRITENSKDPDTWKRFISYQWQDNSRNETRFILFRKKGAGNWKAIKTYGRNVTSGMINRGQVLSYTDRNLTPGTTYCYYVRSWNTSGISGTAARCNITIPIQKPTGPSYLTVNIQNNSAALTWDDRANNETTYRVSKKRVGIFDFFWGYTTIIRPANTTEYIWTGLNPGDEYCFIVKAYNPDGKSQGVKKCITTSGGGLPPEYNYTLYLNAQPIVSGFIPYAGRFPLAGRSNEQLIGMENASTNITLLFLKRGYTNSDCGTPDARVTFVPGQASNSSNLRALFGSSTPNLPLLFVACALSPNNSARRVPINLRIKRN